jgi:hypothetical protein
MPSVEHGNSVDDGKGGRPEAINVKKKAGQAFRYEVATAEWAAQNVYCLRGRRDVHLHVIHELLKLFVALRPPSTCPPDERGGGKNFCVFPAFWQDSLGRG